MWSFFLFFLKHATGQRRHGNLVYPQDVPLKLLCDLFVIKQPRKGSNLSPFRWCISARRGTGLSLSSSSILLALIVFSWNFNILYQRFWFNVIANIFSFPFRLLLKEKNRIRGKEKKLRIKFVNEIYSGKKKVIFG